MLSLTRGKPDWHSTGIMAISLLPSFSSKNVTDLWKNNKHQQHILPV